MMRVMLRAIQRRLSDPQARHSESPALKALHLRVSRIMIDVSEIKRDVWALREQQDRPYISAMGPLWGDK